jgi:Cu(I)/Ag(I) efflux system membrane fusion protein
MNLTKTTLLATLALASLTYCGSPTEEQESKQTSTEAGQESEITSPPNTELGRIEAMSREDFKKFASVDNLPEVNASNETKQHIASITRNYLSLKDALVAGNEGKTAEAAKNIGKQLAGFSATSLQEEHQDIYASRADKLKQDAEAIAAAANIEEQRAYFVSLSRNLAELNQAFKGDEKLYLQYCPMAFNNKGGYWLSSNEEIRNPYFGDAMLKCGRVDREI